MKEESCCFTAKTTSRKNMKNKIREILKQNNFTHRIGVVILQFLFKQKWKEKKHCYGRENTDKIFYVIRPFDPTCGMGSYINYVVINLLYAVEKGWIPVVDMKNYKTMYSGDDNENVWEIFYEQPGSVSLDEVYHSKNVILGGIWASSMGYIGFRDNKLKPRYCEVACQYIHPNDRFRKCINAEMIRIFGESGKKRTLGCVCRGTDYKLSKPSKHAQIFTPEEMFSKIDEVIDQYDQIYLATEDIIFFNAFREKYRDKLVYTAQKRYDGQEGNTIKDVLNESDEMRLEAVLQYTLVIHMLSKCTSLMTIGNGTGVAALYLNGNQYENVYLLNKGVYE